MFAGDQARAVAGEADAGLEEGRAVDDEPAGDDPLLFEQFADFADARAFRDVHRHFPAAVAVEGLEEGVQEEQDDDQDDDRRGSGTGGGARSRRSPRAVPAFAVSPAVRAAPATGRPRGGRHRRRRLVLVEPVVVARRWRLPVAGPGLLHRSRRRGAVLAGRRRAAGTKVSRSAGWDRAAAQPRWRPGIDLRRSAAGRWGASVSGGIGFGGRGPASGSGCSFVAGAGGQARALRRSAGRYRAEAFPRCPDRIDLWCLRGRLMRSFGLGGIGGSPVVGSASGSAIRPSADRTGSGPALRSSAGLRSPPLAAHRSAAPAESAARRSRARRAASVPAGPAVRRSPVPAAGRVARCRRSTRRPRPRPPPRRPCLYVVSRVLVFPARAFRRRRALSRSARARAAAESPRRARPRTPAWGSAARVGGVGFDGGGGARPSLPSSRLLARALSFAFAPTFLPLDRRRVVRVEERIARRADPAFAEIVAHASPFRARLIR